MDKCNCLKPKLSSRRTKLRLRIMAIVAIVIADCWRMDEKYRKLAAQIYGEEITIIWK